MFYKLHLPLLTFLISACTSISMASKPSDHSYKVEIAPHKIIKLVKFSHVTRKFEAFDAAKAASEKDYSKGITLFKTLGMADVPVLDQGQEGTCVTFSSTAALDALIGEGDFISQQCILELELGFGMSYWEGANTPSQIIDPLSQYGVVSQYSCPEQYPDDSSTISVEDYQSLISAPESQTVAAVQYTYYPQKNLAALKQAIDKGHRVLIGFQVNASIQQAVAGFDLSIGGVTYQGGLWACQQGSSPNYCSNVSAGHEVIVIGYDDAQQLLRVRNSWSPQVGYMGDYFMTYTYFSTMVIDQTEIW